MSDQNYVINECDEDFFINLKYFSCVGNNFCCENCSSQECCLSTFLNETSYNEKQNETNCQDIFEKYYSISDKYL